MAIEFKVMTNKRRKRKRQRVDSRVRQKRFWGSPQFFKQNQLKHWQNVVIDLSEEGQEMCVRELKLPLN